MSRLSVAVGIVFGVLTFIISTLPVQAAPIKLSFTASDFDPGAPQDPVSGTIFYEATSLTAPPQSLISIDLTISDYSYSLGEIGIEFGNGSRDGEVLVGGLISGVDGVVSSANDFVIIFDIESGLASVFGYAADTPDIFNSFSVATERTLVTSPVAVAEPSTLALFAMGLLGLAGYRRHRRLQ